MRRLAGASFGPAALAVLLASTDAAADPQVHGGVTIGYGARDLADGARGAFALGVRSGVLFLRDRDRDGGIGPYVDVLSLALSDLQLGGGVEWLLPGLEVPAIVLSAGALARRKSLADGPDWQPGAVARGFVGFRQLNFHSVYGMANGVFVEGRVGLVSSSALAFRRQAELVGGVQIDLAILALPFVLVWNAAR